MARRPDIPKRLAARIRGAQERVRQKRLDIAAAEYNRDQSARRLAEYDSDPAAFAARYYGRHAVDSYPVQTTIDRERQRIARDDHRRGERLRELAALESELVRIEEEVLVEVERMRPTSGRVPWPRKLPPFSRFREEFAEEMRREDERWRMERAQDDIEFDRLIAEEEARNLERSKREDEELRRDLSRMSPEEYARYRAWADYLTRELRSGALTMPDLLDHFRKTQSR